MTDTVSRLVDETVTGQPGDIRNQLIAQTRKLARDGMSIEVVRAALREWDARPGVSPTLLPHLVSDVVRRQRAVTHQQNSLDAKRDWETRLEEEMGATQS